MTTLVLGAMPHDAIAATHLPAGPWCFDSQEEHFPGWEKQFTFPEDMLAQNTSLIRAARAAQTLASRIIPDIARFLSPNADQLPKEYWQVLLAPWAMNAATLLVDRCLIAQSLYAYADQELQVPILPAELQFAFNTEQDFVLRGVKDIQFNHWLLSRFLEEKWPQKWHKIILELPDAPAPSEEPSSIKQILLDFARQRNLSQPFPMLKGMTIGQSRKFSRAIQKARGDATSLDLATTFDFEDELASLPLPDNLLPYFSACLPQSILDLKHKPVANKQKGYLRIGTIAAQEDAAYRQKLAIWKAQGNRLAFCQHGGNYGMIQMPATAQVVEYSQDAFLTWGFKNHGKGRFIPLPSPQLSALAESWRGESGELIFVGAEMPTLRHRLDSHPTPQQFIDYRAAKVAFLEHLPEEIFRHTLYRPYFDLPGTLADGEWLKAKLPGLQLCTGPLLPQILGCKLLVLDHHGTTLLEAMAADIPVVCYWDRHAWQLTTEASLVLEILEDSGIWNPSPEACASKVTEIWPDVQKWWQSPAPRAARRIFCKNFALTAPNPDDIWIERLKRL